MDTDIVVIEDTDGSAFQSKIMDYLKQGAWRIDSSSCGFTATEYNNCVYIYQAILVRSS